MKQVRVTIPESMYEAAVELSQHEGNGEMPGYGVGYIIRRALRAYLSKRGFSVEILDQEESDGT